MEQIEIIKRDGTVIRCFNIEPFCTPTQAVQEKTLMSDDTVKITLRSSQPYKFEKGDKVVINGYTYKIRTTPERTLQSDGDYIHNLTLYGVMYDLMKCQYRNTDANGNSTRSIFDLTYSIKDFVKVAIYNLNRDNPGEWDFDEDNCPDTEPITVSFSNNNVLQVIQDLCSEDKFNLEFRITTEDGVNTIHIGTFGSVVTPPSGEDYFEWGKGNGLWQLQEKKVDDRAIVTRLWAEGGTQNIKSGYRDYSDRLQFPYPRRLNTRAHTLKDGTVIPARSQTIGITADSKRYIEDTELSEEIGVEEETKTFDDIYPRRTGTVSALGASVLEFVDDSMDFDLNAKDEDGNTLYLIAGTSAKITFITGKLAGQQFQLSAYDHESQTFKLIAYTDERGLTIPTEDTDAFRFAVGDKYKITDINMPESYIQNAEEDLWYAALDYFNEAKQARYKYELTFDREYFLDNVSDRDSSIFEVGDYVPIKDTRFGVERNIRIQKVSRNLLVDQDYTLTLSDTTSINIVAQSILDVVEHDKIIESNDLRNPIRNKRRWSDIKETVAALQGAIEGFTEGITPITVNTMSLLVGSESEQFLVYDDEFEAEIPFPLSGLTVGASGIRHFTLGITSDKITTPDANADLQYKKWTLEEKDLSEEITEAAKAYYIYAKVAKTYTGDTGTGEYIASLTIKPLEDDSYYYLLCGILSSERELARSFAPLYGYTEILPNQIRTGAIVSADGKTYFDLATGILSLNDNAGISGTAETGKTQAKSIAAWFGGQRVDLENLLSGQSAQNAASALFRFDGTGYLAKGNITWDANGYGQVGGRGDSYAVKWDANGVRLGSGIKIGAGDETVAMLVQLLQMFELDTTSVAGKTLIKAKYDGFYSMGDITAGGVGTGGGSTGGVASIKLDGVTQQMDSAGVVTLNLSAYVKQGEVAPAEWGNITGTLADQTDLANALAGKYDASNPNGFITSSALNGYATQTWVNQQGYASASQLTNYLPLSGGTLTGALGVKDFLNINNGNWGEDAGIHINQGGLSNYGFDILFGNGDNFRVSRKNGNEAGSTVLSVSRYSDVVSFSALPQVNGQNVALQNWAVSLNTDQTITGEKHFTKMLITDDFFGALYIDTHPESLKTVIPFINNDIAFITKRGGSVDAYTTTSTSFTAAQLSGKVAIGIYSKEALFDGSSSYAFIGDVAEISGKTTIIDVDFGSSDFLYTNTVYIDYGTNTWAPEGGTRIFYKLVGENTYHECDDYKGTTSVVARRIGLLHNGESALSGIRFVLKSTGRNYSYRVATIGLINFNSSGLRTAYMSRGEDDAVWRSITPAFGNTYALGSSSNRWSSIYGENGDFTQVYFSHELYSYGQNPTTHFRIGRFDENGGIKMQFGNSSSATIQIVNYQWSAALFRFDTAGNFTASGEITAGSHLSVGGAIYSNNYAKAGNSATAVYVFNKAGDYFGIGVSTGSIYNVGIGTTTNTTGTWKSELITITNDGNVGIGTTSPSEKLHVVGNIVATGEITAGSDIRWKENIAPAQGNPIMSLQAVEWDWKEGHGKGHSAGFIAQQVMAVIPFAVKGSEKDGYTLNYNVLHAYEVKAIQDHETRIHQLEIENTELRRRLNIS